MSTAKSPISIMQLMREGYASDISITAEGKTLPFHKPIVKAYSEVLAAALEVGAQIASQSLELKCTYATLRHVHNFMYGIHSDEKTPKMETWETYCFADQYEIKFITSYLEKPLLRLIATSTIPEIMSLLEVFGTPSSKIFLPSAIRQLTDLMNALGDGPEFCDTKKPCCLHGEYTCDENSDTCCTHRTVRPPKSHEYRMMAVNKIYGDILELPASIQHAIFVANYF